ncbi:N-ethylmaleimide reductase [Aquicella siphonis]|uniref:N-ethylmaleimide reductase n=1 Tax=Aquicella siphonis TaxID=254247 RepID=A0A5E4PGQ3_9COXI|nr:alkene reductase [Aquicella siphonis]VVC75698.1 N-ethylmaleimide reductase [Aquicella siphonis]
MAIPHIFSTYTLNSLLSLKNRIAMAPMTRVHADALLVPTSEMARYYARRADAGLIITEGTVIQRNARGHDHVPGIFNHDQLQAWRQVTSAVHANQGLIFMQLWHTGRVSHPSFLDGSLPLSSSETIMSGRVTRAQGLQYGKSRAATRQEIQDIVQSYARAASNAFSAGFDGIEIHGANGYLIDQFLHHDTNKRTDEYGGTPENMSRLALEVLHACGNAIGYERVGMRLSPGAYLNEISGNLRDGLVFRHLLKQLNRIPMAYVHTGNFDDARKFPELDNMTMTSFIRTHYQGTLIACGGYTFASAELGISNNDFDLVAMGRPFIANPDLVQRLRTQLPLKPYDAAMLNTLY